MILSMTKYFLLENILPVWLTMINLQFFNPKESVKPFIPARLAIAIIAMQETFEKSTNNIPN